MDPYSALTSLLLFFSALLLPGIAKIWQIPLPAKIQSCYNQAHSASTRTYVASTWSWLCESPVRATGDVPHFDTAKTSYYQKLYDKASESFVRPTEGEKSNLQTQKRRCVRKEYRRLSDDERHRFHNAINTLKQDKSVEPNKYDAIALLHALAVEVAHGGSGFLGWHRVYLLMYETALQEADPTVCLPYWDSTLDNLLENPIQSPIWSSEFLGNGQGSVVEGPFGNWTTPDNVPLIRNVGADGELFTTTSVEDVLSRTSYREIVTSPDTDPQYDLEFHHGAVHVYVGGAMSFLNTAAFEPAFFLHHAFVDYIFELFRTNLRALGVDPEVYPEIENSDPQHAADAPMYIGNLTQADGYLNALIDSYQYEPSPSCSASVPDCGSRYLICQPSTGRCLPTLPSDTTTPTHTDLTTGGSGTGNESSCFKPTPPSYGQPVQNDYCCNKTCDINQWVMLPVKVVSVRPPNFASYSSYPIRQGQVDTREDIYSPRAYNETKRFITQRQGKPKTFQRCDGSQKVGQVYLTSRGINYGGFYKEAAIVDQRQAVSISLGFVAIRKPTPDSVSEAIIRAHDNCGRVCRAACKNTTTGDDRPCSGAVALSSETPLMYGDNYDEAVLDVFNFKFNDDYPKFNAGSFFLTFYCIYHENFPYMSPALYSTRYTTQTPETTTNLIPGYKEPGRCRVNAHCVLDVDCPVNKPQCHLFQRKVKCRDSCRAYAICLYGRFFLRLCPAGQVFDETHQTCTTGQCPTGTDSYDQNFQAASALQTNVSRRVPEYN